MRIDIMQQQPLEKSIEALVLPCFEGETSKFVTADKELKAILQSVAGEDNDFKAKKNETCVVPTLGKLKPRRLILAGLGKRADFKADGLRQLSGIVSKLARKIGMEAVAWDGNSLSRLPGKSSENFRAFAEGVLLGLYRYDKLKSKDKKEKPKPELKAVEIYFAGAAPKVEVRKALDKGVDLAEAVNFSRDLVSSPANLMTPTNLADAAAAMAKEQGITCRILKKPEIAKLGMNALLGVAAGSVEEPRFIILEYKGGKASDNPVVLVGKGITFDSGGISIKPAEGMDKMKYDMGGGAAVIGTLNAVARLKLPINVVGLVPTCENMPSGSATKPGDVHRALNGMTIEILNTDAEGRLILADALSYAKRYNPKAAIDLATLTGACVVALGSQTCGMLGNDEKLIARIKKASEHSRERAWELPLWDEYSEAIKSDIADMKNIGNREAGTITAAAFLKKFVDDFPWVHLDIAGVAWEEGEKPYTPKGASGFGIRLLTTVLEEWS